jgi:hypothetical protein
MKQTKIDLLEPFEKVLTKVLSVPARDKVIAQSPAENATSLLFPNPVDRSPATAAELREVLRCLYDAAHGRRVETQVGPVAIAPPMAPSLKDTPFYIKTQVDFLLEALTRIIGDAPDSNNGIPPPQTFGKRHFESHARNNASNVERKDDDAKIDIQPSRFLRPKRPAFLE